MERVSSSPTSLLVTDRRCFCLGHSCTSPGKHHTGQEVCQFGGQHHIRQEVCQSGGQPLTGQEVCQSGGQPLTGQEVCQFGGQHLTGLEVCQSASLWCQGRQLSGPTGCMAMGDIIGSCAQMCSHMGSETVLSTKDHASWVCDARCSDSKGGGTGELQASCQRTNKPNQRVEFQSSVCPSCDNAIAPCKSSDLYTYDTDCLYERRSKSLDCPRHAIASHDTIDDGCQHTRLSLEKHLSILHYTLEHDLLGNKQFAELKETNLAAFQSTDFKQIFHNVCKLIARHFVVYAADRDMSSADGPLPTPLTGTGLSGNTVNGKGTVDAGVSASGQGQVSPASEQGQVSQSSQSSSGRGESSQCAGHPHTNGNGEHFHHEEHSINQKVSNRHKILTSLMAGGLAGAVAKTTIAPLDRTKINFQTSEQKFSPKKALEFIKRTYRSEGFRALWRGNSATMVRVIPYAAIQYTAHEQYKLLLNKGRKKKHLPPVRRALAGSLAGITATSLTYPLDFARARMAVTAKERYGNLLIVFRTVWREEGWRVVMKGYTPTVIGSCVYSGISFFTYETLKKEHASYSKGVDPTPFTRWCFGACAGILGQCTSYPLDIVRRRMQTAGVTGHSQDYTTILRTARSVYRSEGLKGGLYKGLSMNWIKGPISAGISFMVFETVQRWLRMFPVFHIDE